MSVAETSSTPSSYHHGDLCRALLDATRELIAEGGVQAASLRAVARRAGVSNRAPYHHFENKCALLAAVAAEGFEKLALEVDRRLAALGQDPVERLAELGLAYVTFAAANPGEFQVMFWHELCEEEHVHAEREERSKDCFERLLSELAQAGDGRLEEEDVLSLGIAAWSHVHGLATLQAQGAFSDDHGPKKAVADPEQLARSQCQRLARMLVAEARA